MDAQWEKEQKQLAVTLVKTILQCKWTQNGTARNLIRRFYKKKTNHLFKNHSIKDTELKSTLVIYFR